MPRIQKPIQLVQQPLGGGALSALHLEVPALGQLTGCEPQLMTAEVDMLHGWLRCSFQEVGLSLPAVVSRNSWA